MQVYLNDPGLKAHLLEQMIAHERNDQIVQWIQE